MDWTGFLFFLSSLPYLLHFVLAHTSQSLLLVQLVAHLAHPIPRLPQRQRALRALGQAGGEKRFACPDNASAIEQENAWKIYHKIATAYEIAQGAGCGRSRRRSSLCRADRGLSIDDSLRFVLQYALLAAQELQEKDREREANTLRRLAILPRSMANLRMNEKLERYLNKRESVSQIFKQFISVSVGCLFNFRFLSMLESTIYLRFSKKL